MSTPNIRLVARIDNVRAEPQTAHRYQCGHCERTSLVEVNGTLVVRNRHDGQTHESAFSMRGLLRDYISRADAQQLRDIEDLVQRARESLSLGSARAATAGRTRIS